MISDATVLIETNLVFPEGPRWREGKLWLSDVHAHKVWTVDLDGRATLIADLPDRPSGLGFLPDGTAICACMRTRQVVRLDPTRAPITEMDVYADLSPLGGVWTNDMVVDGAGRAYVGMMRNQGPGQDAVILVCPDGSAAIVAEGLTSPNGIVETPDGRTLIVAQTQAHVLEAFTIQPDGSLTGRRVFADIGAGVPDGICLDESGAVWTASPLTSEVLRLADGGQVLDRIEVPDGDWPVACVLGGPDRRMLFTVICKSTLENNRAAEDFESDLRSTSVGRVETRSVAVPGAGWP